MSVEHVGLRPWFLPPYTLSPSLFHPVVYICKQASKAELVSKGAPSASYQPIQPGPAEARVTRWLLPEAQHAGRPEFPLLFAFLSFFFFLSFPFSVRHKPGCIFTPVHRINHQPASVFALATTSVSSPWEDRLFGLVIPGGTSFHIYNLRLLLLFVSFCFHHLHHPGSAFFPDARARVVFNRGFLVKVGDFRMEATQVSSWNGARVDTAFPWTTTPVRPQDDIRENA